MRFIFPSKVDGWLDRKEGERLFELAQLNPQLGVVVEIGSYEGKSTICLAQGNRLVSREKVYTVDNFWGDKYVGENPRMFKNLLKNIQDFELENEVEVIKSDSLVAVKNFKKSIRFLFIDASHDYEDVKGDFFAWFPHVRRGGIIGLHDTTYFKGVERFAKELKKTDYVHYVETVVSLGVFKKTSLSP